MPKGDVEPRVLSRPAPGLLPDSATGISLLSLLPGPSEGSGYQLSEAPRGGGGCAELLSLALEQQFFAWAASTESLARTGSLCQLGSCTAPTALPVRARPAQQL